MGKAEVRAWAPVALVALLAVVPSVAGAQGGLTARARLLGGYTYQTPAVLDTTHDFWAGVMPELSYLVLQDPRGLLRLTYAFTAIAHTRDPAEIANRLTLASSYELSKSTTLVVSADVYQSSLSNYLATNPVLDTAVMVLPTFNSRLITSSGSETLAWDVSPRVTLAQSLEAVYVTSLDPEVDIDNFFATAALSAERTWTFDGLGVDLRTGYASLHTAPLPEQRFVTLTGAPRWRHDYTPELSSSLSGGASLVLSPDDGARTIVVPYARAALLYTLGPTSAELSYAGGTQPSALIGQMLRSHVVTLRGTTPLSERHRVFLGGSVGYLHGAIVDLRPDAVPIDDFDAILGTGDLSWVATDWMQLFVRGLFTAQDGAGATELSVREAVTLGIQFSTSAPDGIIVPLRLPQRVDRTDVTPLR